MVVNLLFLVLFIALAVLCGWLTWRAIRARRLWVKIAGGLGAGLLTVLFAALALTGGRGIAATYFPGAPAAPDLTVAGTPEQIARGDYQGDYRLDRATGEYIPTNYRDPLEQYFLLAPTTAQAGTA